MIYVNRGKVELKNGTKVTGIRTVVGSGDGGNEKMREKSSR